MRRFLRRWALNRADLILGLALVCIITVAAAAALLCEAVRTFLFQKNTGLAAALFAGWIAVLLASLEPVLN